MHSHKNSDGEHASTVYSGRLSDGRSAAAVDVEVRLGTIGLEILQSGAPLHTWPYASLTSTEPLRPHAIDALVSSSEQPGATLFIPSAGFARDLPTRAPHLSVRSVRRRSARIWMAAASCVVGAVGLLYVFDISPARMIASAIPDATRKKMGDAVVNHLVEDRLVCNAPAGQAALNALLARLSTGHSQQHFTAVVVDWDVVNAFAAPGEQIVIARGLLQGAESADEVAGVLAHEMGHGLELHPETSFVRAMGLSAGAELVLGGSTGGLAGMGVLVAQLSYNRAAEHEADLRALTLLREARISPKGLASFFDRVKKSEGEELSGSFKVLNIFRSHPLTGERRKLVENALPYATAPSLTSEQWSALKAICATRRQPEERRNETP